MLEAPVLVIAAGGGSFMPKKPPIEGIEDYEVQIGVLRRAPHGNLPGSQCMLVAGGGDSRAGLDDQPAPAGLDQMQLVQPPRRFPRRPRFGGRRCAALVESNARRSCTSRQIMGLEGSGGQLEGVRVQAR